MPKSTNTSRPKQGRLFEEETARTLLDRLITESKLYKQSKDYKDLLDFVVRLRDFAPFNSMLLQLQKPGLTYAASVFDLERRFGRYPKEGARPLLIMWPFGPVALVYDLMDTYGKDLPEDVAAFVAHGHIDEAEIIRIKPLLQMKHIDCLEVDAGDANAGLIHVVKRPAEPEGHTIYRIHINGNHQPPVQFSTLAHELAHLCLGHLGEDKRLGIPKRRSLTHADEELEAESVAFIVCERKGIKAKSQTYLSTFVQANTTVGDLDIFQIMRAAGRVEALLGIGSETRFEEKTQWNVSPSSAR